jgi:hypothetical protein
MEWRKGDGVFCKSNSVHKIDKSAANIRLGKMRADEQRSSSFSSLFHHLFRRTEFY